MDRRRRWDGSFFVVVGLAGKMEVCGFGAGMAGRLGRF